MINHDPFSPYNIATLVFSSLAFALSIINFIRTSRVSDRQFSQSYYADIAKWLAATLSSIREADKLLSIDMDVDEKRELYQRIYHDLMYQADVGLAHFGPPVESEDRFLFPTPIAITMEAAELCWTISRREPFEVSVLDTATFLMARKDAIEEVTSAFNVGGRLAQATRNMVKRRPLKGAS